MTADAPKFITAAAVRARIGISHASLYRWVRDGHFPSPVRLSPGRVAFREADVRAWEESRVPVAYAACAECAES